jgi:hypothetical protein
MGGVVDSKAESTNSDVMRDAYSFDSAASSLTLARG